MLHTRLFAVLALLAAGGVLHGQDKITVTVQRGTVTKTAVIDQAAATDAMKALDYLVATSCSSPGNCQYNNETDAVRKVLVAFLAQQLRSTPGTALKAAADAADAATAALDKAQKDYITAAQAQPIQ